MLSITDTFVETLPAFLTVRVIVTLFPSFTSSLSADFSIIINGSKLLERVANTTLVNEISEGPYIYPV